MLPPTPPDTRWVLSAEGWIEFGNWLDASENLERISPRAPLHPDVLEIRCQINANAKEWAACAHVGSTLLKLAPKGNPLPPACRRAAVELRRQPFASDAKAGFELNPRSLKRFRRLAVL
jgi:hypothetical protein